MKTILRFIASSLFLALMVVVGNVTISYAEDTNTNAATEVEETAATQQVSAKQTNTLANAEVKNGWIYENTKGQYLYYQNNKLFTGWITKNAWKEKGNYYVDEGVIAENTFKTIGNDRYYFDYNGKVSTGLFTVWDDSKNTDVTCFADENGKLFKDGFKTIDNKQYYFENYAAVTNGTRTIDGSTYTFGYNGVINIGYYDTKEEGTDNYIQNQTSRTGSLLTGIQLVDGKYEYYKKDHTKMKTGWVKDNGYWYYLQDYAAVTGHRYNLDGKDYFFGEDGKMKTGWIKDGGIWYYSDASGALITGKFTTINGKKYAFSNSGYWANDGIYDIDNKYYGFDKKGNTLKGWYTVDEDYWYYLDKQGAAVTGWDKIGGIWYYFDTKNACMYTGSHIIDGKANFFKDSGAWVDVKKSGWLQIDGNWYYLDSNLQPLVGEHVIDGHTYYFYDEDDEDIGIGTMYADRVIMDYNDVGNIKNVKYYEQNGYRNDNIKAGWHVFEGDWFYYDDVNKPHNGFLEYKGDTYYIEGGYMRYDSFGYQGENDEIAYLFGNDGKKVKSGWYKSKDSNQWYYADGSKNGQLVKGWKTIGGTKYFFDLNNYEWVHDGYAFIGDDSRDMLAFDKNGKQIKNNWFSIWDEWRYVGKDGKLYKDQWLLYKGKWYYFNDYCKMVTGYYNVYDKNTYKVTTYKFDENGALLTGWEKIDNKWYYFDSNSNYAVGWKKIGKTWYYFNDSGKMMTGWQLIDGTYYYLDNSGAMATNKWVGNYYLQANGSMAKNTWIGKYHVDANGKWDKTK